MYHTEGYINKNTYFTKGYLWSNTIVHRGKVCCFWFVKDRMEEINDQTDRRIREWMQQELVCALEKGHVAIGRELNRFGAKMNAGKMHLYYGKEFYSYGDEENFRCFEENGVWVYISPDLRNAEGIVQKLQECTQALRVTGRASKGKCCAEYLGNQIKAGMLLAMSEGGIERGYFLIWED